MCLLSQADLISPPILLHLAFRVIPLNWHLALHLNCRLNGLVQSAVYILRFLEEFVIRQIVGSNSEELLCWGNPTAPFILYMIVSHIKTAHCTKRVDGLLSPIGRQSCFHVCRLRSCSCFTTDGNLYRILHPSPLRCSILTQPRVTGGQRSAQAELEQAKDSRPAERRGRRRRRDGPRECLLGRAGRDAGELAGHNLLLCRLSSNVAI